MLNKNKAKLLKAIVYSDTPVTFSMLCASYGDEMARSVIWYNLQRMITESIIEIKSFKKEGIDPDDYRMDLEKGGRPPKVFYRETIRGEEKLKSLMDAGII